MQIQEDRRWNSEIRGNDLKRIFPSLPECISHSFIAVMPKDSIRLPIILLVLERIRSESQIWKITGHGYRGQRSANDTWSTVILGSFFTFPAFIYLALKLPRDRCKLYSCYVKYVKNAANPKFELPRIRIIRSVRSTWSSAQTSLTPSSLLLTRSAKLLCSYCGPNAYGCNFIYFAIYLFYSIKQQRAGGVLHASENFDRLDMHRCWWIWSIPLSFSRSLLLPLSLPPSRVYIPRYPIPIILRWAIPSRLVESRSRIHDRCRIGVSLIREYADQRDILRLYFFLLQKSIPVQPRILYIPEN